MPVNYFVDVRKTTKQMLLKFIEENKDKPVKQILALFSLRVGLKVSTLEIYLQELIDAGLVEEEKK